MKLFLIYEDGSKREFNNGNSIAALIRDIQQKDVETIVVGDVADGKVLWEKQFNACTIMPSEFGKVTK